MPFVSLAPLDAEFLGAACADAPVFVSLDAGHGPALLAAAAAFGALGCAECCLLCVTRM